MIIYSVTISVEATVEMQWLEWMKQKHIQQVLDTGCFKSARFSRVTSHSQPDATSYSVQYLCENGQKLKRYKESYAPQLQAEGVSKWGDKMLAFRTELEVLEDFYPKVN